MEGVGIRMEWVVTRHYQVIMWRICDVLEIIFVDCRIYDGWARPGSCLRGASSSCLLRDHVVE